jgi:hypothetical protein
MAVEHTIATLNMFIQHYGTETMLARKFAASLEALQLEMHCLGNPLEENNDNLHILAAPCWVKSLWESLHYYWFVIHLEYCCLNLPRWNNGLLVEMFLEYRLQESAITGIELMQTSP